MKAQPPARAFDDVVENLYEELTQGPDVVEGDDTNQEYFDMLLSTTVESKVYKSPRKRVVLQAPTQANIAPPKILSPPMAEVAKKIGDIPVYGEDVIETRVVSAPEKQPSLTKSLVPRDKSEEDVEEVVLTRRPAKEVPKPPAKETVAAKAKSASMASMRARLAKKKEQREKDAKKEASENIDVEENLDVLQNL
jgi:hypothetical protein